MNTNEITKENFDSSHQMLFSEANFYKRLRSCFLRASLVSLFFSVLFPEVLYYLVLLAFILQLFSWFLIVKVRKINLLADEIQKNVMLATSYGKFPSDLDQSHLIARKSPFLKIFSLLKENSVDKIISKLIKLLMKNKNNNKDFLLKDISTPRKHLLSMIQENSFWNHHSYRSVFIIYSFCLSIVLIIAIFLLLFFIPNDGINESMLLLVFIFLTFTIAYERLDEIVTYYESSKIMLEIDNEIERTFENDDNEANMIDLFHKYNTTKQKTSSIPLYLYELNRDKINKAWEARVTAWKDAHKELKLLKKFD